MDTKKVTDSVLSGLDTLTSGEVYFKGQRIDEYSEKEITYFRSNKIGYVYQSIHLIPGAFTGLTV